MIPFLPLYLEQLGLTENLSFWSGIVFSLQFGAGVLMGPFWGKIADNKGRKLMVIRAGFCLSAIYFLTGMATAPWHVFVLRFLNGALTGFIPSSMSLVATNTPKELSARYVASLQTAGAAGSIVGPVLGGMLAGIFGFRGALFASGTLVFLSTLLVIFLVQERKKAEAKEPTTLREDFSIALRTPALLSVMLITWLAMVGTSAIQPILAIHVADLASEASAALSGAIFALPGIALMLTATRWVRFGQRSGYKFVVQRALIGLVLSAIVLGFLRTPFSFAAFFFIHGLFLAALRPISAAIISEEIDESFKGRAFGMQQSATTMGGLIGPLFAGIVAGSFGNAAVFFAVAVIFILGAVFLHKQMIEVPKEQEITKDKHVAG